MGEGCEFGVLGCRSKRVARMMTVLHSNMAWYTEIIIFTSKTSDKVGLVEDYIC